MIVLGEIGGKDFKVYGTQGRNLLYFDCTTS